MNAIIRSGSRFLAMVEEIYARLAAEATTTAGTSETFRLQRAGLNEEGLTISPAFIEQVRRLRRAMSAIQVGRIDDALLDRFLSWDNGGLYGRWPLGQDDGLRLADAVLHLAWLPDGPAVRVARAAAERLVAAAEQLVRAHVANLDRYAAIDADNAAPLLFQGERERWLQRFQNEQRRFRADGVLTATAYNNVVANLDGVVDVGLDRNLATVMRPTTEDHRGTGVSELAGFVGQWRLGLWARRTQRELQERFAADPSELQAWLEVVATASGEAAAWLEGDVLVPTGTIDAELSVEVLEEFLNLPLWRQRGLLYEVWVLCATLAAAEQAGWTVRLALTRSDGVWTLSTGPTADPVAKLEHSANTGLFLEVWREPTRAQGAAVVTPDLVVQTPGALARGLLVMEAKDRWRMAAGRTTDKSIRETDTALWGHAPVRRRADARHHLGLQLLRLRRRGRPGGQLR